MLAAITQSDLLYALIVLGIFCAVVYLIKSFR